MELVTKSGIGSIFALLAVGISETTLTGWVSLGCTLLITITTCFIQIYRLWRDKDSDKKNKEEHWVENLALREALNRLGNRERHIIELRFFEGKTQMEVAGEIGISQAQVSRLEKNALKAMKNYLRP